MGVRGIWLFNSDNTIEAKPVLLSAALDWAMEAYCLSNESPAWPPTLMGKAAKALAASGA